MALIYMALLGLAFGSFVSALVWRLHEKKDFIKDRSECESCHHKLAAIDLIPLFSWLALRGKCRYCHNPIGWESPILELAMASLFVFSYIFWPFELTVWQAWTSLGIWLVYLVYLVALLVYDLRWMTLPNVLVFPMIFLGLIDAGIRLSLKSGFTLIDFATHIALGALALGGFYWILHRLSKGRWVGFGDVKLGLFMGIVLGWQQALLVLFLANMLGFVVAVPGMLAGKMSMKTQIPFGPFLIIAFIIIGLFGPSVLEAYFSLILV